MSNNNAKIKACSKCGKKFECFHDNNCWCNSNYISTEKLSLLRSKYKDCLCPDCLSVYAENKA